MQDKWKATTTLNSGHGAKFNELTCKAPIIVCVTMMASINFAQAEDAYPPQFSWFIGAEGSIVTPHFERDVLGAARDAGPNNITEMLSFDWDAGGAYRGWLGLSTQDGLSLSLSHARLNQSTHFSRATGTDGLDIRFNPGTDSVSLFVNDTLLVDNSLNLHMSDLEVRQSTDLGALSLQLGAGLRYAGLERQYRAWETGDADTLWFNHSFSGFGPSLNYELELPLSGGFSFYNGGRAALLFGEHQSDYGDEDSPIPEGTSSSFAVVTTLDVEAGVQWRGQLSEAAGLWTLRAGVDAQAWLGGGGWDLYSRNAGGTFPEQAGSFGTFGLVVSAQYSFGAPYDMASDMCGIFDGQCAGDTPTIVAPGWFVGAEGGLLTPFFERDILAADEASGHAQHVEVLSFDWDADGAYRGWLGYQTGSGFGVSLSQSFLNQSTQFSRVEGTGDIEVHFDPSAEDIDFDVDGTLQARTSLNLQTTDLDIWQTTKFGSAALQLGAGLRYATFDRSYSALETGGTDRGYFEHSFSGFGPSVHYEFEVPVGHGFSLYNGARAALLFGEHNSSFADEDLPNPLGVSSNMSLIPTLDVDAGVQWRGQTSHTSGEWTLRAGIDAQAWLNGAGWDLYDDQGGATFPQHTGGFGTIGLVASAQYSFGSTPDHLAAQCGLFVSCDDEAQDIVTAGWFVGAEGGMVIPHFERDVLGADEQAGPTGQLQILSFDWDADGTYRGWLGYQTGSGFGISLSHAILNQSTRYSEVETGSLNVIFDPDANRVNLGVDGTLIAETSLDLQATDLEFWQTLPLGQAYLQLGAGLRYASFDRHYSALETGGDDRIYFDHSFAGFGPSLNYEVEVPVGHGFSFYNGGRAAFLLGEHKSHYTDERATGPEGTLNNVALVTTLDAEAGLQWRGHIGGAPGEWTLRAGLDGQAWINGGGWDLYEREAGATFPQHAGSFGTYGAVISAQVQF